MEGTEDWLHHVVLPEAVGVTSAATSYDHPHPEVTHLPIEDSPVVEVLLVWPHDSPQHPAVDQSATFARRHFRERGLDPGAAAGHDRSSVRR